VHHIRPDEVIGISDESGKVTDHTYITAMGLLRVGYDTMIGSGDSGLKDKINKLLRI
jgi:cell division protein FtsA